MGSRSRIRLVTGGLLTAALAGFLHTRAAHAETPATDVTRPPVTWLRGDGALLPRQGGKLWQLLILELWLRSYNL